MPGSPFYCGDAADIYFDSDGVVSPPAYDVPGAAQIVVRRPDNGSAVSQVVEGCALTPSQFVPLIEWGIMSSTLSSLRTYGRPGGYTIEGLIRPADIGSSATSMGNRLGYLIGVHVSDDGTYPALAETACGGTNNGRRLGQYYQRMGSPTGSCAGDPWCTTSAFCTPTLLP